MLRILLFLDIGMACTLYHPTFNCLWLETEDRYILQNVRQNAQTTHQEPRIRTNVSRKLSQRI